MGRGGWRGRRRGGRGLGGIEGVGGQVGWLGVLVGEGMVGVGGMCIWYALVRGSIGGGGGRYIGVYQGFAVGLAIVYLESFRLYSYLHIIQPAVPS